MAAGQLFAGNLASLLITILAFLGVISWPIAGYLIVGCVIIAILAWSGSKKQSPVGLEPKQVSLPPPRSNRWAASHDPSVSEKPDDQNAAEISKPVARVSKALTGGVESGQQPEIKPSDGLTKIGEGDYLSFDLDMKKGEEVVGEVSSSGDVNLYIMNDENVTALDSDQEFWYEAGLEGVRGGSLRFVAPEDGDWFLIVENADSREIEAKAKIVVTMPSHPVSLKTESLELPDAKLEGRL